MDFGKILVIIQIIQEHSDDEPAECATKTGLLAERLEIYKDQDNTPDRIEEDLRIIFIFQVSSVLNILLLLYRLSQSFHY